MKKRILFILLFVLLCQLTVPAFAVQEGLHAEDITVQPDQLIHVKLELAESVLADTMGVYFTYDTTLLALEESKCDWAKRGLIQDFDAEKNAGVWTDSEASSFQGELCTAVFRVIAEKKELSTVINCRLIMKNGTEVVAELFTDVQVSVICNHAYGEWTDCGQQEHSKTCQRCGDEQLQAHQWDEGTVSGQITSYTCLICQAIRTETQNAETVPATTRPETDDGQETMPTTAPTQPGKDPAGEQGGQMWYWIVAVSILLVAAALLWKKKRN